jgi:hypothetical protein
MNLLRRGSHWLTGRMEEHASEPLEYRQGRRSAMIPSAVKIRREVEAMDEDGFVTTIQVHEFRIRSELLKEQYITPRSGDELRETIDGETSIYQVMPTPGRPVARDMANDGHWISVMSKLVGNE